MPAGTPVAAGASTVRGLRAEALATYQRVSTANPVIDRVMNRSITSDGKSEHYFYWLSAPHVKIWPKGQPISHKSFKGVRFDRPGPRRRRGRPDLLAHGAGPRRG